ncbi:unnamed protein product, partial [Onchocerca flexuosa]|uniref:PhoLip_ATPase_N domain-containing protein n=1 Tax=Onchocerca flexuosa TaxID=387005 RepID=A0A183I7E5_9BILA
MNSEKNANYLERARALAECSSVPSSINVSPAQQQKSEKFSKVNFTVNPQQYDRVGYKRVEDITEKNNHCMRHQIRFVDASTQLSQYRCCCNLMHAVTGTKLFLLNYMALSIITFTFAMESAVFWSVIPFVIVSLTIYALCTEKHKYLYPFLIVS